MRGASRKIRRCMHSTAQEAVVGVFVCILCIVISSKYVFIPVGLIAVGFCWLPLNNNLLVSPQKFSGLFGSLVAGLKIRPIIRFQV